MSGALASGRETSGWEASGLPWLEEVLPPGWEVLPLSFTIKGKTHLNWPDNRDMSPKAFYKALREGEMATTAAVNVADVTARLEPVLAAGKDVLFLTFSSALSATCDSVRIAAKELT